MEPWFRAVPLMHLPLRVRGILEHWRTRTRVYIGKRDNRIGGRTPAEQFRDISPKFIAFGYSMIVRDHVKTGHVCFEFPFQKSSERVLKYPLRFPFDDDRYLHPARPPIRPIFHTSSSV